MKDTFILMSLLKAVTDWLNQRPEYNFKDLPEAEIKSIEPLITKQIEAMIVKGEQNPFTKTPYMNFRENGWQNRSSDLDEMMKRQDQSLGAAYCLIGIQDILRAVESVQKIHFDLPKTGSTQRFFDQTKEEYKITEPKPLAIAIWRLKGTSSGHAGLCLGRATNGRFPTFEFNTSPQDTDAIERNGEGAYFKSRLLGGFEQMELRGFVDIIKAIKQ